MLTPTPSTQLGRSATRTTPEEIRGVVEEQERWDREFQQELEGGKSQGECTTPEAGTSPGRNEVGTHPLHLGF